MFNQIELINFTLVFLLIGVSLVSSQTRDLISFNVQQTGSRIHGHYKLPAAQVKVNFQLNQINDSFCSFNLVSGHPNTFDVTGTVAAIEHNDGLVEFKGQAVSESSGAKFTIDTNVTTLNEGHLIATRVKFNMSETIVNYSLELDLLDNCWPLNLRHNLTTDPVDLITYKSAVNGYCDDHQRSRNNVTMFAKLSSSKWDWLNSTLDQVWNFNSTGGDELMTFVNSQLGTTTVTNDWVNGPIPVTRKFATFFTNSTIFPKFKASYLVDGGQKTFSYQPIF